MGLGISWSELIALKASQPDGLLASVGAGPAGDLVGNGPGQDCEIQSKAPVLDVPEIQIDPALHIRHRGRLPSRAVDLRPTGDARLDHKPQLVDRDLAPVVRIMRQSMRARAHQ